MTLDQAQGDRHRSVLGRRFHRRRRIPRKSCCTIQSAASTRNWCCKRQPHHRRRALRRHRGRLLVLPAAARQAGTSHEIRDHLMFGQSHLGDSGPPGPEQGRRACPTDGSLRLQRRVQGRDRQGDQGEGAVHARRRAQAHQGVVVRAVRAPGWSSRSSLSTVGGAYQPPQPKNKPMCGCTDHTHEEVRRRDPRAASAVDSRRHERSWNGARPTAARPAGRRSTTT